MIPIMSAGNRGARAKSGPRGFSTGHPLGPCEMYTDAMAPERDDTEESRVRRQSWPVRKYRLGSEPSEDLSDSTTAEQRLEMMWPLTLEAWSLSGEPLPDYVRSEAPVRRFRRAAS